MPRHAAFLRAINVGGRRVTNAHLCEVLTAAGCGEVTAYQAAGNLILDMPLADINALATMVEQALEAAFGFAAPAFVRTGGQIRQIIQVGPFGDAAIAASAGKPQVAFLQGTPDPDAIAALSTQADQLVVSGPHVFWLPTAGVGNSDLDMAALARAVGPLTVRTIGTIERIHRKFFV